MKAIVQDEYGLPDVLKLQDIDKPVVKDDASSPCEASDLRSDHAISVHNAPGIDRTERPILQHAMLVGLQHFNKGSSCGHRS